MTALIKTDVAALGRTQLDSVVWKPTVIGDAYMAAAADGGYTVNDETWLRRLIEGLISINAWSCWGQLGCGAGGYKDFLTNQPKLLSLRGPNNTPTVVSSSPTVGGSGTQPYLNLPDSGCPFYFNMPVRSGSKMGVVLQDGASDTGSSNGLGLQWTAGGVVHQFFVGAGSMKIGSGSPSDSQPQLKGPSTTGMGFGQNDVATWAIDYDEQTATLYKNGAGAGKSISGMTQEMSGGAPVTAAGVSQTVEFFALGGTNRHARVWGIANVPVDMQAIGALVASL